MIHSCSTYEGSSGSPVISRSSNYSIIGLHTSSFESNGNKYNFSINIISVLNHIKNYNNNYIIAEIIIKKEDINKKIRIICSFEEYKKKSCILDSKEYKYENEKEIKENCEIKINNNKIPFSYYYEFKEEGKYIIQYSFKNHLSRANHMFMDCESITNLDFSNFNTEKISKIEYMFYNCRSLTNINLSNFNTENVDSMAYTFSSCKSLTNIDLSDFNTRNVSNLCCMFYACEALISLNLSNFDTKNVTNMFAMLAGCISLRKLNLYNFKTQKVKLEAVFMGCWNLTKENIIIKDIKLNDKLIKELGNVDL